MFNFVSLARRFSSEVKTVNFVIKTSYKHWQVEAELGQSLMGAGIQTGVPFEVACGGKGECCTCHV